MAKPPTRARKVPADSIEVVVEGVTYRPHEGEFVSFKGRPSIGLYLALSHLAESSDGMERLLEAIDDWDLTDDEGKPYPRPPTLAALLSLPTEEIGWLVSNAGSEGLLTGEIPKNGGSST